MSQKEYAEDTVFWSLKSATQFSARRRTVQIFIANATNGAPSSYTWIDNTPAVWSDLLAVLEDQQPSSIAINAHPEIAFSAGIHAGELEKVQKELGSKWSSKLKTVPMLAVEFVASMIEDRLPWYKQLQETTWALISEAFSERVITPGTTRTEVGVSFRFPFFLRLTLAGCRMVASG